MTIQVLEARFNEAPNPEKVDILLEALCYGEESINLLQQALSNPSLEIRCSAQAVLQELDSSIAQRILWDYLPFAQMECLHTINNLLPEQHHRNFSLEPDYVTISNDKNLLFCYWNNGDNQAYVATWSLSHGELTSSYSLSNSHTLCLGNDGKTGISNDYYPHLLNLETQEFCLFNAETYPHTNLPNSSITACPGQPPLVAFWEHIGPRTEIELWDYAQAQQCFRYVNTESYQSANSFAPDSNRQEVHFSPDGSLLIAKLYFQQEHILQELESEAACSLKVWQTDSAELIHDTISRFRPLQGCSQHPDHSFLLYGVIDRQVTIQGLLSEEILFQRPGQSPCNMTLDGRILSFCTDNNEIEVWDWKHNQKLATLDQHHEALLNVEVSDDREFIITHSKKGSIKIWGVPEASDDEASLNEG